MSQELYYIQKDQETVGPLKKTDVISASQNGILSWNDRVFEDESQSWIYLLEHPDFFVSDESVARAIQSSSLKSSWISSLLAFLALAAIIGLCFFNSGEWLKWINDSKLDWSRKEYVTSLEDGSNKVFVLFRNIGKWEVLPLQGTYWRQPVEGMVAFGNGKRWAFYEIGSKSAPPFEYEDVKDFSENLAAVQLAGKWGYIDRKSKMAINPRFRQANSFSEGLAAVLFDGTISDTAAGWHLIDKNGRTITDSPSDFIGPFVNGLAPYMKAGQWGYLNKEGRIAVKNEFSAALPFYDELAAISKNGKWGFINTSGAQVLAPDWDNAWSFRDNLAAVKRGNYWGFIDKTGKTVIDYQFDDALPFSNGLAAVAVGQKWGLISATGKFVVKPHFDFISAYDGKFAIALEGDMLRFITGTGEIEAPLLK